MRKIAIVGVIGLLVLGAGLFVVLNRSEADRYLGTWNYDLPRPATRSNMAEVSTSLYPDGVPQIGTVTFFRGTDGEIYGHTDQGCTWHFAPVPGGLGLVGHDLYGFNRVVHFGYNISTWELRFDGDRATEVLLATAYLPEGPVDFVLKEGVRARATSEAPRVSAARFEGLWSYEAPSPRSQVNMLTTVSPSSGGEPRIERTGVTGGLEFVPLAGSRMEVWSTAGWAWTVRVEGNTAELDPAKQTVRLPTGDLTLTFFSAAADEGRMTTMMGGTRANGDPFVLVIGSLAR